MTENDTQQTPGKWFTCTPISFVGDQAHFSRDTGLLCKGFQEAGIPCKNIMPGPPMEGDLHEDLIRTDYHNLEDPAWWRSLDGEGVVLYAWGMGKYYKIAKAIKESGLVLITHMDTAGVISILNGPGDYFSSLWRVCLCRTRSSLSAALRFVVKVAYDASLGLWINDRKRAQHLRQADVIGTISPIAMDRIKKVCDYYAGSALTSRMRLIPHPNASYMRYLPEIPKERLMVAVGRWDNDLIKGAALLADVSSRAARIDDRLQIEIYGRLHPTLTDWHHSLDGSLKQRIHLKGIVPNTEVRRALQRAMISVCTSMTEGYHTVSAEALCCGCSIVGPNVREVPTMKWFATEPHGRMAARNADALANAVIGELKAWDAGERDPVAISETWTTKFHAPNVARLILKLADQAKLSTRGTTPTVTMSVKDNTPVS